MFTLNVDAYNQSHLQLCSTQDLEDSVTALKQNPDCVKDGKAPVYGMANINPDRAMVGEILVAVQDNLLD